MVEEAAATALELYEAGLTADAHKTADGGQSSVRSRHEDLMRQAAV